MSDNEFENNEEVGSSQNLGSDYEIPFSYTPEKTIERAFDKAEYWVKQGVRPDTIYLEDRKIGVINFKKTMKDPLLIQAGVERFVDFRCSLTISAGHIDAVFSSICYYEQGQEPTYINQFDPELSSIQEVLNMVSQNLFNYLQKPLATEGK